MNASKCSCYLLRPPARIISRRQTPFHTLQPRQSQRLFATQTHLYASKTPSPPADQVQSDKALKNAERYRKFRDSNPILANYIERDTTSDSQPSSEQDPQDPTKGPRLASSSILQLPSVSNLEQHAPQWFPVPEDRNPISMAAKLDPKPSQRRAWERKMVILEVKRRGRISKALQIKRSEAALTARSAFFPTSIKKLQPLANQIAGKPIEDAIVQMRFSKKGAAVEVKKHLEEARLRAIVERGMGLGQAQGTTGPHKLIRLRDGKRHIIKDRTGIYVDQAWVGRGSYIMTQSPRARGQVHMLRHPETSISVLLKEEKTRIREHEERQEKYRNRKIWTPLPDRPVTQQRQQYCW